MLAACSYGQFSTLTVLRKPANRFSWLNMPVQTLIDRLEEVMAAKDWSYADLVRHSGESRSVVSQWLGRSSKVIHSIGKMQAAERLEEASGYAALWIAKGVGDKMAPLRSVTPKVSPDALGLAVLFDRIADRSEQHRFRVIAAHYAELAIRGELSATLDAVAKSWPGQSPIAELPQADVSQSGSSRAERT